MTKTKFATYQQKLVALQHRLTADVSSLSDEVLNADEQAGNRSHVPIHPADLGTDAYDRQLTQGLLENERQTLAEIAAGLERIEQGTFGRCEACQKQIPETRLLALPYARYCVECAENPP